MIVFSRIAGFAIALALPATAPAQAQAQLAPSCESANGYSLSAAEQLIAQGDAIIVQVPDCSQVNLMICEDAEALYSQAAQHVQQVFFDAKGEGCTYCDIGRIGSVARLLADRETYFRQNLSRDVSLSAVWNDWQTWSNTPTCQAAGNPVVAPPVLPNPPAGPALCQSRGGWPNSRLDAGPGLRIPGVAYQNECEGRCDQNDWCRSYDFDANNGVCVLFDRKKDEAGLLPAPQGYAHFDCDGRR